MACGDKVYIESFTEIVFTVSPFTVSDISEIIFTFTLDANNILTKKLSTGGVTISGDSLLLEIDETDITEPGPYTITSTLTDLGTKIRKLNVCPESVTFHEQG